MASDERCSRKPYVVGAAPALAPQRKATWLVHKRVLPVAVTYLGLCLAPFCFSLSAIAVATGVLLLTGLGVTVGLHRLLSHRSFSTYRWLERVLATLGTLAFQGGVIDWVAIHRLHHAHSDSNGDPHSPTNGFWHAYFLWLFKFDARIADESRKARYVPDLLRDRYMVFLENAWVGLQGLLFLVLYSAGELLGPNLGLSWAVYGVFVRSAVLQQMSWLVNTASHKWGYKNAETKDQSVNCWWVALLALGEGWHNNHHACPHAASFGWSWYEWDSGFWAIRLLQTLRLAWDVVLPGMTNGLPEPSRRFAGRPEKSTPLKRLSRTKARDGSVATFRHGTH